MLISKYWCFSACPDYVPDNQLILFLGENFRNSSGTKTEKLKKLKNRKTEFSREIQEEILHMDSVFLFFSFSVFPFCLRNYSGIFAEKLKNWIFQREPGRDSAYGFSFSVFLFFSFAYGTIPEYLRRHFGIFAGKQKNMKNWIFQRDPGRDSPYGFSFSVFQYCGRIGQEELDNCILRVSFFTCHVNCIYD